MSPDNTELIQRFSTFAERLRTKNYKVSYQECRERDIWIGKIQSLEHFNMDVGLLPLLDLLSFEELAECYKILRRVCEMKAKQ